MARIQVVVTAAAVSAAAAGLTLFAGLAHGRHCTSKLRKLLNGNERWMSKQERQLALALIANGQEHLFKNWPKPGVRDAEKRQLLAAAVASLAQAAQAVEPARLAVLQAPVAARRPKQLENHGDTRQDDYYWLRDDERKDRDVLAHIGAENEYTKAVMADTQQLQEELYKEMRSRIQEQDTSVPERLHGFYYYSRTEEGQQYPIHCRRRVAPGAGAPTESDVLDPEQPEEVLLDENKRKAEGGFTFYAVATTEVSPNQQLFAWCEDTTGNEHYTLRVKDLATGAEVMEPIQDTSGDVEWAADNKTLFYVVKDDLERPYKVLRHVIGQPAAEDQVVFEEQDEAFYTGIQKSRSEEVIFISSGSAVTSETHYLLASEPQGELKVVLPRVKDVEYRVAHYGSSFFLTIRDQQRPNSELRVARMDAPEQQQVLLAHNRDVKLESVSASRDFLAVMQRSGGLQRATVYRLPAVGEAITAESLGTGQEVAFEEPAYSLEAGGTGDFDSPLLRLHYTSMTTPNSVIDYNMATGARAVKKVQPVLGGFKREDYVTERLWATAKDGVKVPISLAYKRGAVKLDGSDPLLLDGYGSYEICNDPYFSSNRLCLLDRGWVLAVAHIRGGGEMGRYWYEDGKYTRKMNTFTDYIACAEHLIANKYAHPKKLCAEGASAGGLLMGAAVNMRPDLFHSVIMGVPFVDALTTVLDETIPLTITEWEEWGCPKEKEFYDYMKSYSPVDNIKPQAYPHILATAGLHDPRVGYWEPAKFVAKLRQTKTDGNLLLLKTEMGAGHFSVTGRFDRLKEIAFEFAFLLKTLNMDS